MNQFIPFFLVLFTVVLFSELFKRLHLPWVAALIIGGMVIGPYGLGFLEINSTIEFLGQVGLVFLMFIAGLETKLSTFKESKKDISIISIINGCIPFVVGFLIGQWFGLNLTASLLLGIIFISSSIAVVIPIFESIGLIREKIGKTVVASVIVQDVMSLLLLSVLLQSVMPTRFSLPVFFILFISLCIFFRFIIPKIQWLFSLSKEKMGDVFEQDFQVVFTILIGMVIAFEFIELHQIIAGFIAGLLLSDVVNSKVLKDKIQFFSYGIFIPIFFIVVGSSTNFLTFLTSKNTLILTVVVVLGSVLSKFISGYIAGRLINYKNPSSILIGLSSTPSLSTTLAVAFTGVQFGLIGSGLATALVTLSVVTSLISPILIKTFGSKVKLEYNLPS